MVAIAAANSAYPVAYAWAVARRPSKKRESYDMRCPRHVSIACLGLGLILSACGGASAPVATNPGSAAPSAALASVKPSAAPSPITSAAASASPKPAASTAASAKPAASASASASASPAPTATTLPVVAADTTQEPLTVYPAPNANGATSIDTIDINQATHTLYVDNETEMAVDVYDVSTSSAKYVRSVSLGIGSNGMVILPEAKRVITGNRDSSFSVIDTDPGSPTANTVITKIPAGGTGRIDLVYYDPVHKKVYGAANGEGFIAVVDPATSKMTKKIATPGTTLEAIYLSSADGMLYVGAGRDNALYQVDPNKDELAKKIELADKCIPNGIAINPQGEALLGCNNPADQHV